jgi:hypothetical protein
MKEKIIQIYGERNGFPVLLTSKGRILSVCVSENKDLEGFVISYNYFWADITPNLKEIH